jgi:hypothetical protein
LPTEETVYPLRSTFVHAQLRTIEPPPWPIGTGLYAF